MVAGERTLWVWVVAVVAPNWAPTPFHPLLRSKYFFSVQRIFFSAQSIFSQLKEFFSAQSIFLSSKYFFLRSKYFFLRSKYFVSAQSIFSPLKVFLLLLLLYGKVWLSLSLGFKEGFPLSMTIHSIRLSMLHSLHQNFKKPIFNI